jgi:hypothetical protein
MCVVFGTWPPAPRGLVKPLLTRGQRDSKHYGVETMWYSSGHFRQGLLKPRRLAVRFRPQLDLHLRYRIGLGLVWASVQMLVVEPGWDLCAQAQGKAGPYWDLEHS